MPLHSAHVCTDARWMASFAVSTVSLHDEYYTQSTWLPTAFFRFLLGLWLEYIWNVCTQLNYAHLVLLVRVKMTTLNFRFIVLPFVWCCCCCCLRCDVVTLWFSPCVFVCIFFRQFLRNFYGKISSVKNLWGINGLRLNGMKCKHNSGVHWFGFIFKNGHQVYKQCALLRSTNIKFAGAEYEV